MEILDRVFWSLAAKLENVYGNEDGTVSRESKCGL